MICNYCSLREIKSRAEKENKAVTVRKDTLSVGGFIGFRVFVHPRATDPDQEAHFVVWFAALPKMCLC